METTDDYAMEKLLGKPRKQLEKLIEATPLLLRGRCAKTGRGLLHVAVDMRRVTIIELLVNNGADINVKDDLGGTPLVLACLHGEVQLVKMLLRHGADPNARDLMDLSPLSVAARTGHNTRHKIMSLIEDAGGERDVLVAICARDAALFERLLPIAVANTMKYLPHLVPEFVQMWLSEVMESPFDADVPALIRSLLEWSERPLSLSMRAGADINGEAVFGGPPAIVEAVQSMPLGKQPIDFLVAHGADINLQYRGRSVLDHAISEDFRAYLRTRGAKHIALSKLNRNLGCWNC